MIDHFPHQDGVLHGPYVPTNEDDTLHQLALHDNAVMYAHEIYPLISETSYDALRDEIGHAMLDWTERRAIKEGLVSARTPSESIESDPSWAAALKLSRSRRPEVSPELTFTTELDTDDGDTVEVITEDDVFAYGEASGHTWHTLKSGFASLASSCDFDGTGHVSLKRPYVDKRGRQSFLTATTPDNLAYVLAKHGRYGVRGASEQTVELLADLLVHYAAHRAEIETK